MKNDIYRKKIYDYLEMPFDNRSDEENISIETGEFCPADTPEIVVKIADIRIKHIRAFLESDALYPENYSFLYGFLFHSYSDFLLTQKHEAPKKGDYISPGHSLDGFSSDMRGYLAYLKKHAPDLARFFFMRLAARIPEKYRKRHTYISGSSGSGKTELMKLLAYAAAVRKQGYCTNIFLDPNGDAAEEIAKWKENKTGDNLIYFDVGLKRGFSPVINPLDIRDRSPENIDRMAQLFISVFDELLQDSSLSLSMRTLLKPCLHVLMAGDGNTLVDLQRFMDSERNDDLIQNGLRSRSKSDRDFFRNEFHHKDYSSTKRSISKKIQSLLNFEAFYNATIGKSTIDLEELMNSKKLVVFNLSKGKLGVEAMPALGKFLVAMIQGFAMKRGADTPKHLRVTTHLFLDECHNFITPAIEEILKESRKYALHLSLAQQTVGDGMNFALLKNVMTNTEVKITGYNDAQCLDTIANKTHTPKDALYRLSVGKFSVKCGKGISPPSFTLYAPRFLLGNKNVMSHDEWEAVREQQLEKYYRSTKRKQERTPEHAEGVNPAEIARERSDTRKGKPDSLPFQRKHRTPIIPKYQL